MNTEDTTSTTRTDEEPRTTFRVPQENWGRLQDQIAALNRRARKIASVPITLTVLETQDVPLVRRDTLGDEAEYGYARSAYQERPDGPRSGERVVGTRHYLLVRVDGERPVINGWRFIATLNHLQETENGNGNGSEGDSTHDLPDTRPSPRAREPRPEDGQGSPRNVPPRWVTILRAVPGESVPPIYRTADPRCDHCRLLRWRRDTYVVRHVETGDTKQVGSDCLKDFLGHQDPKALAALAEYLALAGAAAGDAEDLGGGGGGAPDRVNLDVWLETCAAAIRTHGWVSRKAARDFERYATADRAYDWLFPASEKAAREAVAPEDADKTLAAAALEWSLALSERTEGDLDDYLHNVSVVARSGSLDRRMFGIAASIIPAYQRAVGQEVARKKRIERAVGLTYLGTIGTRSEFTFVVKEVRQLPDKGFGFGPPPVLHRFEDADGNEAVWFAGRRSDDLTEGRWVRVKATVKRHDTFRDTPQTVLNRVTVLEVLPDMPKKEETV